MPTCGACKQSGQTVDHIRACYQEKRSTVQTVELSGPALAYVQAKDFKPMALAEVPDSKYALERDGVLKFYRVRTGTKKWAGFQFLDQLIGAPGDWRKIAVRGDERKVVMQALGVDPKAAAIRYSRTFTVCAVCESPLSDPESVAAGLGPICAKRF